MSGHAGEMRFCGSPVKWLCWCICLVRAPWTAEIDLCDAWSEIVGVCSSLLQGDNYGTSITVVKRDSQSDIV